MAGKVVNLRLVVLSKFVESRKESALKTATSHMCKPSLVLMLPQTQESNTIINQKKMTKEQELVLSFTTEVIRPWQELNQELSKHYSVSPQHSVFTNKAYALAVALKHFSETNGGPKSAKLNPLSESYSIISDLADTKKHGKRDNPARGCTILTGSLYEKKFDKIVLVRFLRNTITMNHATYGKRDFMETAKDCALFLVAHLNLPIDWRPLVFNNDEKFSNKIKTHASKDNQVIWTEMNLNIVELNDKGEYVYVDLNGTIEFELTSEF